MKKFLLMGIFILLSACATENNEFCGTSTLSACEADSDCIADGCSGQICRSENDESYLTTCEWKDCYENKGLECKCVENKCSWN